MSQPAPTWTVLDRGAGVLCYTYAFTKNGTATTFVARMANGQLMVVSPATGMSEAAFAELSQFGVVGAIVANNGFHHLGQIEWRARFPTARCFAAAEASSRIKQKNAAVGPFEPLSELTTLCGDGVGVRAVPNTKAGETWSWAKIAGGYAWYTSDVLANIPHLPPFPISLLFKWTGSAPGFRVFNLGLKFIVKDRAATLRLMLEDLEAKPPITIVPGHGDLLHRPGLANETHELIRRAL